MDSSPSKVGATLQSSAMPSTRSPSRPTVTRQPSLLPPAELFSSSPPPLSHAQKRKFQEEEERNTYYPTPIPTSSTGILPSSPPRRPGLQRTLSTLSERAPLGDLPTITVPANGEAVRLGRSSNSSDHQLPYNRHISRVHVTAHYEVTDASNASGKIIVECVGWNGVVVHCGGVTYALDKGDTWESSQPSAEIMLDVMDCRVMVQWPNARPGSTQSAHSDKTWVASSPRRAFTRLGSEAFASSPPPMPPHSPISPSPARLLPVADVTSLLTSDTTHIPSDAAVQVYEDRDSESPAAIEEPAPTPVRPTSTLEQKSSFGSLSSSNAEDLSDQENEENDPVVHSFGPFGSNLLSRLNSFSHTSPQQPQPQRRKAPLKDPSESPKHEASSSKRKLSEESLRQLQESPIKNHVINQLAFSRVHSMPLTTIHTNLPAELRACKSAEGDEELTHDELERVLHSIPCVGEITRQDKGKDAAGKPLENEFYYLPEMDENAMRRDAVIGGRGGTGLRAVRKSHKVRNESVSKHPRLTKLAILLEETTPLMPLYACIAHLFRPPSYQCPLHGGIFCLCNTRFPNCISVLLLRFSMASGVAYAHAPLHFKFSSLWKWESKLLQYYERHHSIPTHDIW